MDSRYHHLFPIYKSVMRPRISSARGPHLVLNIAIDGKPTTIGVEMSEHDLSYLSLTVSEALEIIARERLRAIVEPA